MKIEKLGQVVKLAAKSSTLLVVALLSFLSIECSYKSHVTRSTMPSAIVKTEVERDSYSKTMSEQPLDSTKNIAPSVDVKETQLNDGSVMQVKTTVQPDLKNDKVITTTETWTMYDYAKAAAIGLGVGALGYAAYANRDQIADKFNSGYNAAAGWLNGNQNLKGQGVKSRLQNAIKNNDPQAISEITEVENAYDERDRLLSNAVRLNKLADAKTLIAAGANTQAFDKYYGSPLHRAVVNNNSDMVELLLKEGYAYSEINKVNQQGRHGSTEPESPLGKALEMQKFGGRNEESDEQTNKIVSLLQVGSSPSN